MLKVGITGGIGTGKTMVCNIFKMLGIPIYDADTAAKELVESDPKLKADIIKNFGSSSYSFKGHYNRAHIRQVILKDEKARLLLNSIIHPAVFKDNHIWFEKMKVMGHAYALKEAAILYETKSNVGLDKVIVVDAPIDLRIERIIMRDHISEEEAWLKVKNQMPQEEKIKRADYIIQNDGHQLILPQVFHLHQILIALSTVHL